MVKTRPYRVDFNDQVRMVEASHQNGAIAHLARQLVKDVRPATAKEVAEHYRAGGKVELAGEEPEPKTEWPVAGARAADPVVAAEARTHGIESAVDDNIEDGPQPLSGEKPPVSGGAL